MDRFHAKICLQWFKRFEDLKSMDFDCEVSKIESLLKSLANGELVVCIPYSDGLKNDIILPDKDVYVPHEIRTYHEDIGFNRCLGVMVATGRMKKA
jgi:hypothetical protein